MIGWDEGDPRGGATSRRIGTASFDCRTSSRARCAPARRGGEAWSAVAELGRRRSDTRREAVRRSTETPVIVLEPRSQTAWHRPRRSRAQPRWVGRVGVCIRRRPLARCSSNPSPVDRSSPH